MKSKNVLLVIPSAIVAKGIGQILSETGEFEIRSVLTDLSPSSIARVRNLRPDLIVLDPSVLDQGSRAKGRDMLGEISDAPVVAFFSQYPEEETARRYEQAIALTDSPSSIVWKLRSALEAHSEGGRQEGESLSSREKEILVCVAKGMLNKEIADRYNISIYTVITHRKNISRKTGIKTVAGLTVYALLNNLIDVSDFQEV